MDNQLTCPHCGHLERDAWEIDFGPGLDGDTDMLMSGLITDSQAHAIRTKKFPKFVGEQISSVRRKAITRTAAEIGKAMP